jgi:hypothetical protein
MILPDLQHSRLVTETLALDAEHAGSPRDEAIDAVSTRPREDQPNEDQRV